MPLQTRAPAAKIGIKDTTHPQGPIRTLWELKDNLQEPHNIVIGFTAIGQLWWIEIRDRQHKVISRIYLPRHRRYHHIFAIKSNLTIEIREYDMTNDAMIKQIVVQLKDNATSRTRAFDLFDTLKSLVQVMSKEDVPFFNLGFKRMPPVRSGISHHNLRQLAPPKDPNYQPWQLMLAQPATIIKFTNGLAHRDTKEAVCWLANGLIPIENKEEKEWSAREMNNLPKPRIDGCAECGEGSVPRDLQSIKAKLFRKEWVGCQEGENCRSASFWYHIGCTDIGRNINLKQNSRGWVCKPCRPHVRVTLKYGRYVQKY